MNKNKYLILGLLFGTAGLIAGTMGPVALKLFGVILIAIAAIAFARHKTYSVLGGNYTPVVLQKRNWVKVVGYFLICAGGLWFLFHRS